jgi:hypothetical protein
MAIIAPDHMLDERSSYEYLREIAHVDPTAARFASEKCSASSIGCTPTRLPMTVPRGIGGVMLAILVTMVTSGSLCADTGLRNSAPLRLLATGFGYLNFLGRSCREPFGGDQNASICLLSKQSEQLRLFLVRLRKR